MMRRLSRSLNSHRNGCWVAREIWQRRRETLQRIRKGETKSTRRRRWREVEIEIEVEVEVKVRVEVEVEVGVADERPKVGGREGRD